MSERAYLINNPVFRSCQHARERREVPKKIRPLAIVPERPKQRLHPLLRLLGRKNQPLPLAQLVLLSRPIRIPSRVVVEARLQPDWIPLDLVR
ncbi:MAG: hypothetical protein ACO3FQ_04465, partial [Terrimicrobiaceae bacterium]